MRRLTNSLGRIGDLLEARLDTDEERDAREKAAKDADEIAKLESDMGFPWNQYYEAIERVRKEKSKTSVFFISLSFFQIFIDFRIASRTNSKLSSLTC